MRRIRRFLLINSRPLHSSIEVKADEEPHRSTSFDRRLHGHRKVAGCPCKCRTLPQLHKLKELE